MYKIIFFIRYDRKNKEGESTSWPFLPKIKRNKNKRVSTTYKNIFTT